MVSQKYGSLFVLVLLLVEYPGIFAQTTGSERSGVGDAAESSEGSSSKRGFRGGNGTGYRPNGDSEMDEDEGGEKPSQDEHTIHVTAVVKAIAVCLFGFLFMNFSLLYLMNYRDEDVRGYIYRMLSNTISIFCAVLLNQAFFSFFLKQFLVAPWPRGLNIKLSMKAKFAVGFFLFTWTFCLINFLCHKFRHKKEYLYAVATIGGHLCAFAGIYTFGELQQRRGIRDSVWGSLGILVSASIFLLLYRVVSQCIRKGMVERDHEHASHYEPIAGHHREEEEEEEEWEEYASEAEDEAAVLILSYLMFQCICFAQLGILPDFERELHHYEQSYVLSLARASLFFLVLLLISTGVRTSRKTTAYVKRIINGAQNFITMSFCWCIQTMGEWQFLIWLEDAHLSAVITAFAMTAGSVVLIIVLDAIADSFREFAAVAEGSPERRSSSRAITRFLSRPRIRRAFTGVSIVSLAEWTSWEQVIRTIINGFGLLVGLSWDKAFDVAELGIVHGFENSLAKRPVISRIVLGFGLVAFVMPAWIWYIVPKAQKNKAELEAEIEAEIEREEALQAAEGEDVNLL